MHYKQLRKKAVRQKEKLTKEIVQYGLWQTQQDIREGMAKQKSKTAKLCALKAQMNFRKRVLEQNHSDKTLFSFSKDGKQLSVEELTYNLNL